LNRGLGGPVVVIPGEAPPIGWDQTGFQSRPDQPAMTRVGPQDVAAPTQNTQVSAGVVRAIAGLDGVNQDINEFAEIIRADVELMADDFAARPKIVDLFFCNCSPPCHFEAIRPRNPRSATQVLGISPFGRNDMPEQLRSFFLSKKEFFTMSIPAECPECAAEVNLPDDVMEGEIVQCADCGAELEVTSLTPPTLELAPEEEEDWGE
jgi:alpha-aminoadipate carrier protein LysW